MTDLNELFKIVSEGKKQYEETDPTGQKIKRVKEHVKEDLSSLFSQLVSLKEDLEKELVVEEAKLEPPIITEEIPYQPVIHTPEVRAAQVDADVDKYLTDKSFQQPNPDLVSKNIDDIRNKIKFLEQAIGRVAAAGPGGGEINLRWLDDVDRSTINDGWYLRYSESKKKFEFAEVQASGGNGATGATGIQGPQGATGLTGATGAGLNGASGIQGASGSTGPQGPTGASGIAGASGSQGQDGASGADSTVPGASGVNGLDGATGPQGIDGASGIQGASGVQGTSGATGTQGASGSTGLTGATGLQGDRYQTTSTTTQTIVNNGQLTFYTTDLGLAYSAQQTVIVVEDGTNHMHGTVVSYDGLTGELVLDINSKQGSGTYSFWTINLDGAVGAVGATGLVGATGVQGASGVGATGPTGATGPQGSPGSGGAIANYGSFYDLSDQVALAENTAYPIPLGYTAEAIGTSIVDGTKVKVDYDGVYNVQFSLQLHNRGGAGSGTVIQIWLRKNGVDVVDSATKIDVDTNSPWQVPAWNFMLTLNANDYVQLMWSTNNVNIVVEANTATSPAPAIPSTILTIQQVMYTQVGATGYTGATGSQGIQGVSGSTGPQGASGATGVGATGLTGATGVQGASGTIGTDITVAGNVSGSYLISTNASGDEGGEINLAKPPNATLSGGVNIDAYQNKIRIFEQGGSARGVSLDLSKAPAGVGGELAWKVSAIINAGTFVTMDNLKVTVTTSGNRGLSVAAVSGSFTCHISGWYAYSGSSGNQAENITYTTTPSNSAFGWNFALAGNTAQYHILDNTNSRFYRITMMIGASYNNNFISIERLL